MTRTARARLAVALTTGLLLTGCTAEGVADIGVAASVGEDTLTVTELQENARLVNLQTEAPDRASGETMTAALRFYVTSQILQQIARVEGIDVGAGQVAEVTSSLAEADQLGALVDQAASTGVPERDIEEVVRVQLILTALQEQQVEVTAESLTALTDEVGVEISPRYGTFDVEADGFVDPLVGGGLSRSVEAPDADTVPLELPGG